MSRPLSAVPWVLYIGAFIVICIAGSPTLMNLGALVAIWSLWVMSLNLIWGYAGQFSMVQVSFVGISAYVAALLAAEGWGFWTAALAGVVASMLVAAFIGGVTLKLDGFLFSIMTLAFVLLLVSIAKTVDAAGKSTGMIASSDIGRLTVGPVSFDLSPGTNGFLLLCGGVSVATLALTARLMATRSGRAMLAIRGDEPLASSLGIPPARHRIVAFVASAVVAGVCGILYGAYLRFISPDFFGFQPIMIMIIALVLGGRGYLFGPVVGASIYFGMQSQLHVSDAVFGIILIAVVMVTPGGVCGLVESLLQRQRQRRQSADVGGPELSPHRVEQGANS